MTRDRCRFQMCRERAGMLLLAIMHGACCCTHPLPVASPPSPRMAAVRVVILDPVLFANALAELKARNPPGHPVEIQAADLLDAAYHTDGDRGRLEGLVSDFTLLGAHVIRAIVPLSSPADLIIYARSQPDGRVEFADQFALFVRALDDFSRRRRGVLLVEKNYILENRDLRIDHSQSSSDRKATALQYREWAHIQINYRNAVSLLNGAPPGDGVVIGHPDTGYTENCQFYGDDSIDVPYFASQSTEDPCLRFPEPDLGCTMFDRSKTRVHPEYGYDFYQGPKCPHDPMCHDTWEGLFRFPGHGTKTGTTILSPHTVGACNKPQTEDWVWGISPASRLVPIRVTDGIVLGVPDTIRKIAGDVPFDSRVTALALALQHSADLNDPWLPERPHIVSISMGGVCSEGRRSTAVLRCEARRAEFAGLMIVAAAGQYPYGTNWLIGGRKPVAFPGMFESVITVAGSTILAEPWDLSARGKRVDITAPAEWVWRGETISDREPTNVTVDVGDGTSFATAIVAGTAALWLQKNGGFQHLHDTYGPGLTSAFRWVLRHHGTATVTEICDRMRKENPLEEYAVGDGGFCDLVQSWNTKDWGPGLLDAKAVLDPPLPTREEVCIAERARAAHGLRSKADAELICAWTPGDAPIELPPCTRSSRE
jgi:hypothetical protein